MVEVERRRSPAQLFTAIVVVGAAMGCSSRTTSSGDSSGSETDMSGSSTQTSSGTSSSTGATIEPTTGPATSETGTGTDTSTDTSGSIPKFDVPGPDLPPPVVVDDYFCCGDDSECKDGEVCTLGLYPLWPSDGICTPLGCQDPVLDCPLGDQGVGTPTCVGDPPVCAIECTNGSCPLGLSCMHDGQAGWCVTCVVPIA